MSAGGTDEKEASSIDASKTKAELIVEACKWRNISELRELAISPGGFLTDELRRQAWPILLGIPAEDTEGDAKVGSTTEDEKRGDESRWDAWRDLPRHRDEDQVQLDVNRSFVYYPNTQSEAELDRRKRELSDLIVSVLRQNPWLCYFQGYHDICQVFLLVLCPSPPPPPHQLPSRAPPTSSPTGDSSTRPLPTPHHVSAPAVPTAHIPQAPAPPPTTDSTANLRLASRAVTRLSALRIRDFMLPSLQPAITQLRLIPQIVRLADPQLYARLRDTEPFFALSGTLTMYAHDVTRLADIARIFDALLASPSTYSVYLFAMLVLARRDELLAVPVDEPDVLHWTLSRLPQREMDGGSSDGDGLTRTPSGRPLASGSGGLDLDALVRDAASLQQRIPPTSLPSWRRPWQISPASVLLTAADPAAVARQSVEVDGRRFFERQAADLRRREMLERWANWVWQRRHVAAGLLLGAGGAVVVGVAAWWWVRKV